MFPDLPIFFRGKRRREKEEETEGRREEGREGERPIGHFDFLEFDTCFNHFSVPPASHPVSPCLIISPTIQDKSIFKSILDLLNSDYTHHS